MNHPESSSIMNGQFILVIGPGLSDNLVKDLTERDIAFKLATHDEVFDDNPTCQHLYVVHDFDGSYFTKLREAKKFIYGITALKQTLFGSEIMTLPKHPLHNFSMSKVCMAMSKVTDRYIAKRHLDLVHFMGGSCRKMIESKVKFLVAYGSGGDKYRTASNTDIPIMSPAWIDYCWEQRFVVNFDATDLEIVEKFRLKPFEFLYLAFVKFPADELKKMEELTVCNGGSFVQPEDPRCTHIVVYAISGEQDPDLVLEPTNEFVKVVYEEWFWTSLQIRLRAEESATDHAYPWTDNRLSLAERTFRMSQSVLSPNLDYTRADISEMSVSDAVATPKAHKSKRRLICEELIETEENYIQILEALVNEIQREIANSKLLDEGQVRIIFGKLPEILKSHQQMCCDLKLITANWRETNAIAAISKVFIEYAPKLLEKYPSYVNSLDSGREIIEKSRKDERFFALLKKCESRPECKRASLTDLLSRPFQRLFHVRNLLQRLMDDLKESSPDSEQLALALEEMDKTLQAINEKKRTTESHLAQFAELSKIKDLPLELISATNRINGQVNARKLRLIDGKLVPCSSMLLTLFLLNDVLEICKRRSVKRSPSFSRSSLAGRSSVQRSGSYSGSRDDLRKPFRHIGKVEYSAIKAIESFKTCPGYESLFILILRPQDSVDKEDSGAFRYLPFWVEDETQGQTKTCDNFINLLAKRLYESGQSSRDTVLKRGSPPSVDLRYSEKFFSASSRCKSKTMSFRFAKRFKMESMKGTISPLVTKQS